MKLFGFEISRIKTATTLPRRRRPARTGRSFNAAAINRLTNDFAGPNSSADAELFSNLQLIRFRCRQLERNNDYIRRYFKLVENNVLGAYGIGMQSKSKDPNGRLDPGVNNAIELGWYRWGKKKTASLNGRYSWKRIERLMLRSAIRDGAALLRFVLTPSNPYGFTLQPLEIDHLDYDLNRFIPGGNEIRMGIEMGPDGRIVGYHLLSKHPGDQYQVGRRHVFVPADEMIHLYLPERIGQSVGLPSAVSSMLGLQMLGGYQEAEVVAAREGACKGGYIKKTAPEGYEGDDVDAEGNQIHEMEPGVVRELEPGQEFIQHDPTHPNTAYGEFVKGVLRGLAAGLGVSYTSLANDLEGVNYSSIRAGLLEEREEWKALQCWLIEDLHEAVFEKWLELSLINGALTLNSGAALPVSRYEKFNMPDWKPRRWPWVDPLTDVQASKESIGAGLTSRKAVIAENGGDIEEVDSDLDEDKKLTGLDIAANYQTVEPSSPAPPQDDFP
jgi:lambda family phage portal protein